MVYRLETGRESIAIDVGLIFTGEFIGQAHHDQSLFQSWADVQFSQIFFGFQPKRGHNLCLYAYLHLYSPRSSDYCNPSFLTLLTRGW